MLRQISKAFLMQNGAKLARPVARTFSATRSIEASGSSQNHNYKWMFAALGCFGAGYMGNKLFFEKKKSVEIKTEAKLIKEKVKEIKLPEAVTPEIVQENKPATPEVVIPSEFDVLIKDIKNCQTSVDIEKIVYSKDINTMIGDFDQLDAVFNAIFQKKKEPYSYNTFSTVWLNNQEKYLLSYLDNSIGKHTENLHQLKKLLTYPIKKEGVDHIVKLIHHKIPNMIDNYDKLHAIASGELGELISYVPDKQIHDLFFQNLSSPEELGKRLTTVFYYSHWKILKNISNSELRDKIVVSPEILNQILETGRVYDESFLDRLGKNHIRNLLSDLPPLQIEKMKGHFPNSYVSRNESLFEDLKKRSFANRATPRP